jgi:Alpha amylase, catalytic domain/Carbohydrate-binding module 48 (Isoamylase N-terminal domain)
MCNFTVKSHPMAKSVLQLFIALLAFSTAARSQLLNVAPSFPKDTTSISIVADCAKGNQGLYNYANPNDVYVHVGVITNLSANSSDWRYVKFTNFNAPNAAAKADSFAPNKYRYVINNIRTFFGVPAAETIKKIAILFRNGAGTVVQRNSDASDMYIPVYDSTLATKFNQPPLEPRYIPVPEPITKNIGDGIDIIYQASQLSTLRLFFNGTLVNTAITSNLINTTQTITASGAQQIVGEANNGTITIRDTLNFFVAPVTTVGPLPAGVKDGINYEPGDTSVILVLRAPNKTRATVIGDFNNWTEQAAYQMTQTPDGKFFWLRITGLTPSTEYAYQYYVDGQLKIADPYTEKILDPSNDQFISATTYPGLKPYPAGKTTGIVSVLQTNAPAYNWQVNTFNRPDKHGLVIYELLLRDFVAAHDWKTLKDTLNYLKNLGVTAVEIMPFNEFEGNISWGYNPDFYFAPDKYYGAKNTLKTFVDECHKDGIAVVMDIALNHSFGSSPMVQLYFDAVNNRPAANNPWFNPAPKHAFNVGYDMNHESPDTKYYFDRITAFWLQEYKLDGFRFDLSKGFTQKQTCDNNGNNCDVNAWGLYDSSRVTIWKRYYDSIQTYSNNSYVILEHFAANNEEIDLSNYGMLLWGNLNAAFNEATMGYLPGSNFEQGIHTVRGWTQPGLVTYMESHDEERLMYKNINFGNAAGTYNIKDINTGLRRNEMAAAFCLMIPGPKMIWQFGELGYDFSINTCQDGTVNNNCRLDPKPIKWDYLQVTSRKRLHDIYAALLKLRANPLFKAGFLSNRVDQSLGGAFKWLKLTTDTSNILVIGNFDVAMANGTVTFQNAGTWYDYLTGETITATAGPQSFSLQYGEYHVYVNRNVTNVVSTPVYNIPNPSGLFNVTVLSNPVQPGSQLKIELPSNGKLQIALFDALGRQQAAFDAGYRAKGVYQFLLSDILKSKGIMNTTGVYMVKINFNNDVKSLKLLVNQ